MMFKYMKGIIDILCLFLRFFVRYLPEVMGDGVAHQNNNPEVDVDVRKPNFIINQQLMQLKLITNRLWNAYNGVDVDWIDTGMPRLITAHIA